MTKHPVMAAGSAVLFLFAAGCQYTRIAEQPISPEQKAWQDIIRDSYPDYTPPPRTSRAFKGHTEERVSAVVETPLKPMDDPAGETAAEEVKPADDAAPVEEIKPADDAAPVEEIKPADDSAAPVEEVKPADNAAPAEEVKPADNATPAEEVKPADNANSAGSKVSPPDPTNSTVYEVNPGDSLGLISKKVYGDARFSGIIFKANSDILKDKNTISPGMKLIIPKL